MKNVPASTIARDYGFTSRHWIRMAAHSKLSGAYQPSGPGGHWLFDTEAVEKWFKETARKPQQWPTGAAGLAGHKGLRRLKMTWGDEPPLRGRITELMKAAMKGRPK